MSKANAVQEPSMDEILASIRKIIETGDERGLPSASGAGARFARFTAATTDASVDAPAVVSGSRVFDAATGGAERAFAQGDGRHPAEARAGLSPQASFAPAFAHEDDDGLTAALESELAASWGSIEAGARTAAYREAEPTVVEESFLDVEPVATADASPASDLAAAPFAPPAQDEGDAAAQNRRDRQDAAFAADVESHRPDETGAQTSMEPNVFEPANTDTWQHRGEARIDSDHYAPIRDSSDPLASMHTGSLVAASFDELAHAIRNGELKSLEGMAQDMLRPMLQEWLDDNLPRMVERLVREEIERMARGGRR